MTLMIELLEALLKSREELKQEHANRVIVPQNEMDRRLKEILENPKK